MGDNKLSGIWKVLGFLGCIALFFLLKKSVPQVANTVLVIGGVVLLGIVILTAVVLYFAFHNSDEKKDGKSQMVSEMLAKGRSNLVELRRIAMKIKSQKIRTLCDEICGITEKILRTLREHPDRIPAVRQFLNYYLPTLGNVLLKYSRMEQITTVTPDITEKTIDCLSNIKTAMGKQYMNLFEEDVLDLTVEMEAMTLACKRDGLLEDENYELKNEGRDITLTL